MSAATKVGAFAILALLIAAWFVLRIQQVRLGKMPGVHYEVALKNAEGLQAKGWVLFRGVRVGKIADISLEDDGVRAKVNMTERVPLRVGTTARIINVGLLGEKQLELVQGPEGNPLLPNGAVIPGRTSASLDSVLNLAKDIGADVQAVTSSVKSAVAPDAGVPPLQELTENLTLLSRELRQLVEADSGGVRGSLQGVQEATAAVTRLADQLSTLVAQNSENATATSESLRSTAQTLQALATRLEQGQGTVGHLLQSNETGERIDQTLDAVKGSANAVTGAVEGASGLGVRVGIRADWLASGSRAKGYFGLTLLPRKAPWFLHLEAVALPEPPPVSKGDRFGWTGLVGYRFDHFRGRMGFIESSVGLGGDSLLLDGRLRLSADVWDLSRPDLLPHARLEAAVYPVRSVFVVGGWDDALNVGRTDSFFLGAGLVFEP